MAEKLAAKKRDFYDLNLEEMEAWCRENGLESYRARQILAWQKRGLESFSEMTDLKKEIRLKLAADFDPIPLFVSQELSSQIDQTKKYLLQLRDKNIIEAVLMHYRYGASLCISTQVGCRMGCSFCASADLGLVRDLTAGEMLAQVALIGKLSGNQIKRVNIMGIGEPLDNYANVVSFIRRLSDPEGLGISPRRVTLSTCCIIDKMLKFIDEYLPITMTISLHAPNQNIRELLMPIARKYRYKDIIEAGEKYARQSKRRITYEYALFSGINDKKEHAWELAANLQGKFCHVNIIPANQVPGIAYRPTPEEGITSFIKLLADKKIKVTRRRELGRDIAAACGQLRRSQENA